MDDPRPNRALGVPFTFTDVVVSEAVSPPPAPPPQAVVPRNDTIFHAGIEPAAGSGSSLPTSGSLPLC